MARRTKAEAEQTRHSLLDAAETLFLRQGVSRTSLHEIAQEAGTTRGAIYWHFKDKADLFNAMMDRVTLPLEHTLQEAGRPQGPGDEALRQLLRAFMDALHATVHDPQTRRVFHIAIHKVEYVDELQAVADRRLQAMRGILQATESAMLHSAAQQRLTLPMPVATAALGLHMLIDGLITHWLMEPDSFNLENTGRLTLTNYLCGLGFSRDLL
ncbi:MAG: TetR family transcriptional regulator [Serpentinimonas sp.]|jgi:TetR/AcrR family acrAB operon transcriptional repressor|nr:TetR family transcriptional regulator [Serpentinimonas sp.]